MTESMTELDMMSRKTSDACSNRVERLSGSSPSRGGSPKDYGVSAEIKCRESI